MPKPKLGFYFTEDDVRRARDNVGRLPWAKAAYERMKRGCDALLELSDDHLYGVVLGMRHETFAYGVAGCPHCGKPFKTATDDPRELVSDLALWPLKRVACPNCETRFPNERYPDDGQGFKIGEKGYYPVGMWNFHYGGELLGGVRDHEGAVTKLTYLYMLTGDEAYARKAIVLLDAFAAIMPGTIGPRDFTPFGSDFEIGRLHLLTSIVHRVKVFLAHDYDWLYRRPELDEPSPALAKIGKSGTVRNNIEAMLNEYMLSEPGGPVYDLRGGNLSNLQNHESDGVRAMLAVGLVLDNEEYRDWGVRAVEAYYYNAIGRDGMYYEGSYGYSLFTASVLLDVGLLAARASTPERLAEFHPFGCDRFFRFAVVNPLDMMVQGHLPSYGDWGRDRAESREPDARLLLETYRAAQQFRQFSPDAGIREAAESTMRKLYPSVRDRLGGKGFDLFFGHAAEEEAHSEAGNGKPFELPKGLTSKGQAGIVVLRDRNETTALLRYGPSNTHSHDDVLAIQLYAYGRELSADIGYGIYGTNAHFGWASKSIAHHTVVVNRDEGMKAGQLYKPFAGGELGFVFESERVTAAEAKAPGLYGIEAYQRMVGLVPIDAATSYVVDWFEVEGAETADYAFHAFHKKSELRLAGVVAAADEDAWTLSGADAAERGSPKLYFDEPGKSFGERLSTGETFTEFAGDERPLGWTSEPNNGYGYVFDVRAYRPGASGAFEAVWTEKGGHGLRLFGVGDPSDRLYSGLGPSLDGDVRHPFLVWRSREPRKRFAAVLQPYAPGSGGRAVESVAAVEASGRKASALAVRLSTGETDYWAYAAEEGEIRVKTEFGEWLVEGRCGWLRVGRDGRPIAGETICGVSMRLAGAVLDVRNAPVRLRVTGVDIEGDTITVAENVPERWRGVASAITIRSSRTGRTSTYPVRSAAGRTIVLGESVVLSKGIVADAADAVLESRYPLPLGADPAFPGAPSPFEGKTVLGRYGGLAVIRGVPAMKTLAVETIRPFRTSEPFDIADVEPGDEATFA
ncbi:heparinase II/III domain-containing protein [Paenibacillus flagellatus]|nr:heparinase II/III family protein [Paenibacillus flagellatus]